MRIAFISDSHGQHPILPDADLLVHCGDLTGSGSVKAFESNYSWLESARKRYPLGVLYTPGNHDRGLDREWIESNLDLDKSNIYRGLPSLSFNDRQSILKGLENCGVTVLIDQSITIDGLKFHGSPFTPIFRNWAFMGSELWLAQHWARTVPKDTDVLVTHGPPKYILDLCPNGNVGSDSLTMFVKDITVKLHAFGHIHEGAGIRDMWGKVFLNASVLDGGYRGFNPIHVINTEGWALHELYDVPTK
jgi:Icc-related predicted phosphoesterase